MNKKSVKEKVLHIRLRRWSICLSVLLILAVPSSNI
jgi:hypothetical protein